MKQFRLKLVVINEKHYKDVDTLRHYEKHQFNRIENYYFNEPEKKFIWNMAKASYPGLKKTIQVFKRSNPVSIMYGDEEVVKYTEELIHGDK